MKNSAIITGEKIQKPTYVNVPKLHYFRISEHNILTSNCILGESGSPENTYNASSMSDTSSVKSEQQQSTASGGEQELKESIFKSQMRRLNRELPISDVYHERNIGLGMAPPLSKLIMTNNLQVVQVDHHSSGMFNMQCS